MGERDRERLSRTGWVPDIIGGILEFVLFAVGTAIYRVPRKRSTARQVRNGESVGGGFAPISMAIVASLAATQINKPLTFWRKVLPEALGRFLAKIWSGCIIAYVVLV